MSKRNHKRAQSAWWSFVVFLALLTAWVGMLTLVFMVMFEDFLYRLTHPHASGWAKGPWGFLFIYGLLCIPVFPLYNLLESSLEGERRKKARRTKKESES